MLSEIQSKAVRYEKLISYSSNLDTATVVFDSSHVLYTCCNGYNMLGRGGSDFP